MLSFKDVTPWKEEEWQGKGILRGGGQSPPQIRRVRLMRNSPPFDVTQNWRIFINNRRKQPGWNSPIVSARHLKMRNIKKVSNFRHIFIDTLTAMLKNIAIWPSLFVNPANSHARNMAGDSVNCAIKKRSCKRTSNIFRNTVHALNTSNNALSMTLNTN